MAVTVYTASAASGYMTDVQYGVMGNKRYFTAHFSGAAGTANLYVGFPTVSFALMDGSDPAMTITSLTDGAGGIIVQFSGQAAACTGRFFVLS